MHHQAVLAVLSRLYTGVCGETTECVRSSHPRAGRSNSFDMSIAGLAAEAQSEWCPHNSTRLQFVRTVCAGCRLPLRSH